MDLHHDLKGGDKEESKLSETANASHHEDEEGPQLRARRRKT